MRNSAPSHRNQTGDDCGWPDADTVVSQMIDSSRSLASAAACRSLSRLSILIPVPSWSLLCVEDRSTARYDRACPASDREQLASSGEAPPAALGKGEGGRRCPPFR